MDELHDDDRLAHTGAPENPGLSTFGEGCHQVYHLETSLEYLGAGALLLEGRRRLVNGPSLLGLDGSTAVDRFAQHVEEAPQRGLSHRDHYRRSGADGFHTPLEAVRRIHRQAAHPIAP
jgi:hypothetical protein